MLMMRLGNRSTNPGVRRLEIAEGVGRMTVGGAVHLLLLRRHGGVCGQGLMQGASVGSAQTQAQIQPAHEQAQQQIDGVEGRQRHHLGKEDEQQPGHAYG